MVILDKIHLWLDGHPIAALTILVAIAGASCAGGALLFRNGNVRTVETERLVYKDKIEYRDRIVEKVVTKTVYVHDLQRNVRETVVDIKKPDGTTEHRVDTVDLSRSQESNTADQTATKTEIKYIDRVVEKTVDKVKIVEAAKPQWRVSAGVGYDVEYGLGHGLRGVPGMKGFAVALEVDRRVIGPFWLGVEGVTTGLVGIRLGVEF
jgi:hypothetical protein